MVSLIGESFELETWSSVLKGSFDPYVEEIQTGDLASENPKEFVLRLAEFDRCKNSEEVREIAVPLIRQVNGAVSAFYESTNVQFGSVLQRTSEGKYSRTVTSDISLSWRGRARAVSTGTSPAGPTEAQQAVTMKSENFIAALGYFGQADNWYDLYKAYEAIKRHLGKEKHIHDLGFSNAELNNFKLTAQLYRHHYAANGPFRKLSLKEGRSFVAKLITLCVR